MREVLRLIICASSVVILFSCVATKHVTITCEPSSAGIYINDVYQGVGIVKCEIPIKQKYVEISCSEDGVNFAKRRFYIRSMNSIVNFKISEYMQYSSGINPTFN